MIDPNTQKQYCDHCKANMQYNPRYPHAICKVCRQKLFKDESGRKLKFYNSSMSGGFLVLIIANEKTEIDDSLNHYIFKMEEEPFLAQEARFGGIMIQKVHYPTHAVPANVKEYIRTERGISTVIYYLQIEWQSSHETKRRWVKAKELPASISDQELVQVIDQIYADPKYFMKCHECLELSHKNHIWRLEEGKVRCEGCAEQNHGIVH